MMKFYKLFAALAALSLIGLGFSACAGDDDDDDGSNTAAVTTTTFAGAFTLADESYTSLSLASDNTYTLTGDGTSDNGTWAIAAAPNANRIFRAAISAGNYTLTSSVHKATDQKTGAEITGTFTLTVATDSSGASTVELVGDTLSASGSGTAAPSAASDANAGSDSTAAVEPYLPDEFKDKTIIALYVNENTTTIDDIRNQSERLEWEEYGITKNTTVDAFYFFGDGTWVNTIADVQYIGTTAYHENFPLRKGTYTGNAAEDGTISMTYTHEWSRMDGRSGGEWEEEAHTDTAHTKSISNGKFRERNSTFTKR